MNLDSILRPNITVPHLALAKGWANGLDLADLGRRYFPAIGIDGREMDLRQTKSTLLMVMQELALAAGRAGIPGGVALIRSARQIRPRTAVALPSPTDARPSFEEFVASLDHADAFSEAELIAAYQDRYPPTENTPEDAVRERRSRLVRRQLDLIERLQRLVTAPIQWSDPVAGWFSEGLASRLQAAGLGTIESLGSAIVRSPDSWYDQASGIGAKKARQIQEYLAAQGLDLEHKFPEILAERLRRNGPRPLSEIVLTKAQPLAVQHSDPGTGLPSPAPSLILPGAQDLDGSAGRFRQLQAPPIIDSSNDFEALQAWLKNKNSPATVRVYEREVMRLIAWSIGVQGKPLSSLMYEDALSFRDFLAAIPPELQTKKGPRPQALSGQAEGVIRVPGFAQARLSPASINKTLVIISGFFTWLQAMRYINANPFFDVRAKSEAPEIGRGSTSASDLAGVQQLARQIPAVQGRSLPQEAIEAIDAYLDSPAPPGREAAHARVRFIFYFAYFTGLRISEIAEARRAALGYLQHNPSTGEPGGWYMDVFGKGNKYRRVSVPDQAIAELERYLAHRDLITLPCPSLDVPPGTFLVGGLVTRDEEAQSEPGNELAPLDGPVKSASKKIKNVADGVRPQTIHLALKELFRKVLVQSQFRDQATTDKIRKASTHWLRHTSATHALAIGVPVEVVSSNLGHASLDTTSKYIDAELRRNLKETRLAWDRALAEKKARRTLDC